MIAALEPLPDDIYALKALLVSERLGWAKTAAEKDAELTRVQDANARLWDISVNCGVRSLAANPKNSILIN